MGEAVTACFIWQCPHAWDTVDFPAAPKGQVFWIRSAKARSSMIGLNLNGTSL